MNNSTMKRCDITIKLRGDNVYDLYLNGKWISSRGSYENILDEMYDAAKYELLHENEQYKAILENGTRVNICGRSQSGTILSACEFRGEVVYSVFMDDEPYCLMLKRSDFEVM
jgi:hypothetical protein